MAVNELNHWPAQPTTGTLLYSSVGGDGLAEPLIQAYWQSDLTGDASGGFSNNFAYLDPAYTWVINWCGIQNPDTTVARDMLIRAVPNGNMDSFYASIEWGAAEVDPVESMGIFSPPPMLLEVQDDGTKARVEFITNNVNGQRARANLHALGFKNTVRDEGSLVRALASVPRAGFAAT